MSLLSLDFVTKSYTEDKKENVILDSISYAFPNNGLVFIYGNSGSGKSTILHLLLGIDKPTSGRVLFNDKDLNSFTEKEKLNLLNNEISIVFQNYNLLEDLSAYENVLLAKTIKRIDKDNSDVDHLFKKFDIEYLKNQKVKTLSGGEKARISLLRALINKPSVILSDEPTGSLDDKNGKIVIETLKEISKDKLVIVVTHDNEIIKKYGDVILELKDKKLKEIKRKKSANDRYFPKKQEIIKQDKKFLFYLVKSNLSSSKIKSLLIYFSTLFSFLFILLSIGFYNGVNLSYETDTEQTLLINNATISEEEYVQVTSSSLLLSKQIRPNYDWLVSELQDFGNIDIEYNLSYFFPQSNRLYFQNNEYDNVTFYPYNSYSLDIASELLIGGSLPSINSLNEVVVNQSLVSALSLDEETVINKTFSIYYETDCSYYDSDESKTIYDTFSLREDFVIKGVIKEFSFLLSPRVYYSYDSLVNKLISTSMINLSDHLGKDISYYDYLFTLDDTHYASSYSYQIFLNGADVEEVEDSLSSELIVTSLYLETKEAYISIMDLFSTAFLFFTLISLIITCFLISLSAYSTYILKRKESAILSILGLSRNNIFLIYLFENLFIVLISLISSLILSPLVQLITNTLINNLIGLENIIKTPILSYMNFPLLIPLGLLAITVVLVVLAILIPLFISKKHSLKEELKEE